MNQILWVLFATLPYLIFTICIAVFFILYKWAKKRKAAAIGLGMMMHLLMPVPNVEQSITQVVEKKQIKENVSKQTKIGEPK
jgi:phosphotransferase system  glucose/maltose/N-acetylglucosamine-specific IIC component